MESNSKIKQLSIKRFFKIGIFKTLYFNFKTLPFVQAIKFPFILSKYTNLYDLSGTIKLNCTPRPGLITIGFAGDDIVDSKSNRSFIDIKGTIEFGGKANIGVGNTIKVGKHGFLRIGNDFTSGHNVKFICMNNIRIGNTVRIAWDSQLLDTNFHFIKNTFSGDINRVIGKIKIGNFVWIGNRSAISKNTILLNYSIITSNSLCNKDYSKFGESALLGGTPAKFITTGLTRVFDKELEAKLFKEEYEKYINHD